MKGPPLDSCFRLLKPIESSERTMPKRKYCLFDASVLVEYFLKNTYTNNSTVSERAVTIIESVRSGKSDHFFYIPNFCIAEVFSTLAKHAFGHWNRQVKHKPINSKVHNSLRKQFESDIHNATLFYHYELARYHILTINMVAPVDHYYKLGRGKKNRATPAGTFDQLIVAMGIQLTKIHGADNVVIITADRRLTKLINKCRSKISLTARKAMRLSEAEKFVGIRFDSTNFPLVLNLASANERDLKGIFMEWPLPIANRYKKPYHLNKSKCDRL